MTDTDGGSDLIRADSKGRVLVPAAHREVLLDAFERSGQSAMAFSRLHGIKYPTFANWVQCRRKKAEGLRQDDAPAFTEVIMDVSPGSGDASQLPEPLRISLGNGFHVDVASRKHLPWVAELLRHLSSSRPC
jgi:hypothetical protein